MKKRLHAIKEKARPHARLFLIALVALLFLSVFKASIFDSYLTSTTSPEITQSLELNKIPEELRTLLRDAGHTLSEEAILIKEEDGKWRIEDSEEIYFLIKENNKISIYTSLAESQKIWFEISFILLLAISAELLVVYLKQPTVMILLLLGIIISPSAVSLASPYISKTMLFIFSLAGMKVPVAETIPHLIPTEGVVEIFAQLGAIFLLFKVGLHSEIQKIFNTKNFFVAFLGIILPFIGGYFYADLLHPGNFNYAMFLGAALTATSVGITVAVLNEFSVLDKDFAKIILGAAVIDDILGLLVLSIVKNFPSSPNLEAVTPFLKILATAAVFVVGGIKVGQYLVNRYFNTEYEGCQIPNQTFLGILVYLLAYSYVAEFIGLSAIVGAFIAGVTLNYSKIIHRITEAIYPLEALFTPIFFVSLGMFVDIVALTQNLIPIIMVTVIAVLTKILSCGVGGKIIGANTKDSLIIGIGMVPRGEVALIIGLVGLNAGILHQTEYSIIASMAFLTTVIIPPLLSKAMTYAGYRK